MKPVQSKSSHQDKENVFQTRRQESAPPQRQPLGSVKVVENFNDSSDSMETDSSPMVLDTNLQTEKQWRVPPLGQHKPESVDVFSAPEYAEVRMNEIFLLQNNFILSSGYLQLPAQV